MTRSLATLAVEPRFRGPPHAANGGYLAGLLAAYVPQPGLEHGARYLDDRTAVTVMLRAPTPLDVPMAVDMGGEGVRLRHGDVLEAEARHGVLEAEPVPAVPYAVADEATVAYRGRESNPFGGCFVCGLERAPGDGLRVQAGPVREGVVAAPWVPDASLCERGRVRVEFVWAALDCPGAWSLDGAARVLLVTITGKIDEVPEVDERCVIMGAVLGRDGRKSFTTATLYDEDGRVLARVRHVWITIDPTRLNSE